MYVTNRLGNTVDVAFRLPGEGGGTDTPAPGFLRVTGREHVGGIVRLVVNRGEFSRTDVHWARQGGVHLLNGHVGHLGGAARLADLADRGSDDQGGDDDRWCQ